MLIIVLYDTANCKQILKYDFFLLFSSYFTSFCSIFAHRNDLNRSNTASKVSIKIELTKKLTTIMTQQEFENLTGLQTAPEDYKEIENVYLATSLDKEEFCEMWKDVIRNSRIMESLLEITRHLTTATEKVEKLRAENKKLKEKHQELLDSTFQNAQKLSPNGLRDAIIKQIGKKAYLKKLLTERKGSLWSADRQLLLEMLEGKAE